MANRPAGRCSSGYCLWPSGMLMSASSERMVNDIHRHSPDPGPIRCRVSHLVEFVACFDEGLLSAPSSGNNADCRSAPGVEPFRNSARHLNTNPVWRLVHNDCLNSAGPDKLSSIIRAGLNVADVSPGWDGAEGERVSIPDFCFWSPR